jgi:hypothetical protein
MNDALAEGLNDLAATLNRLNIPFLVGGALASSARGIVRATFDGDLLAAIGPIQAKQLAEALGANWYADVEMIRHALEAGRAFNLIHIPRAVKFDVFPASSDFHASQLKRATVVPLGIQEASPCPVATAEDILVAKLIWYRESGETSDGQWGDIAGILAQNPDLDWEYTRAWAARLRVSDLLDKAQSDAQAE